MNAIGGELRSCPIHWAARYSNCGGGEGEADGGRVSIWVCVCVNMVLGNQTVVCGSSKVHEGCGSGEKHLSYFH